MGSGRCLRPFARAGVLVNVRRGLSTTPIIQSGHNRWSKIKHDKAKDDAAKSRERTQLSQEIALASKYGGPDPSFNPRLAFAIASAKRGQLAKSSIDAAIAKGQGKSTSGAALENITVEAMLPHGVAAIIEYQTDSKARILQDIRHIMKTCGGTITPTAFLFDRKGKIWFEPKEDVGVDEALEDAIEAGAEEISLEEQRIVVETAPTEVSSVAEKIQQSLGLAIHKTEILFTAKPETTVTLQEEENSEILGILESIEDEPNLQNLYVNLVTH